MVAQWNLMSIAGDELLAEFSVKVEVIEADEEDPDGYGEVTLEVRTVNWQHRDLIEHAEIVAMCAIDCREASWTPGHHADGRVYSIADTAAQIEAVVASAQDPTNLHPRPVRAGEFAHYAHRELLTDQYVEGTAAIALCGRAFVPRQVPDELPTCAECEGIYRSLESVPV